MHPIQKRFCKMVRDLSDKELWGLLQSSSMPESPKSKAPKTVKKRSARQQTSSEEREALLTRVKEYVVERDGVSSGEVSKGLDLNQSLVARYLKILVNDKRIASAGDRRFTRYAKNKRTATAASKAAQTPKISSN